jgi:CRP/FNR family transcriptional regulator, cyclic AMP receptor protein
MQTLDALLSETEVFRGLDRQWLELVAGCGQNAAFDRGSRLFRDGRPADTFFLLRRGRVALTLHVPGRGDVVIETLEPGEVVGWSWLFPPYRWHFDAVAVDGVGAIAFDGACLRGKCDDDPTLGYELMKRFAEMMIGRLQQTRMRLLDVYGDGHGS